MIDAKPNNGISIGFGVASRAAVNSAHQQESRTWQCSESCSSVGVLVVYGLYARREQQQMAQTKE